MSADERPALHIVPTELSRSDAFWDMAGLATSVLVVWYLWLRGVPVEWMVPLVLVAAVWMLTGEPAGDTPFIGAVASGLRSKLGLRRAHEWLLAFGHYTAVRTWPDLRAWWASSPSIPVAPAYPRIPLA